MQTEEVRLVKYDRLTLKWVKKNGEVRQYATRISFGFLFAGKMFWRKKRVRVKRAAAVLYVGEVKKGLFSGPSPILNRPQLKGPFGPGTKPRRTFATSDFTRTLHFTDAVV
jgi:hypothetical protein